jgi:LysR family positive regulator for ilvC
MDINKLKLFCTLATTLHFGNTARLCHASPSTISRRIKQLEEELGKTLFERDNRSVLLTGDGQNFLLFAKEILQQWELYQQSLHADANQLTGQLSIYCSVTASYSFLFDILTRFRSHYPGIALKIHTGDPAPAIERVLAGNEDIAIAAKPRKLPAGLGFKTIARSPLIFITARSSETFTAPIPAPHGKESCQRYWADIPMIISEEGISRERIDRWFKRQQIHANIYAEVKGHEAIVSMVSLGFGIGVLPRIVLENSPLADKVVPFHLQPDLGPYELGLCVMEKRLKSPIVEAFWQQLTDNT